ncbi:MAG TPA: peptidoglycan DD-metalloendopeptidase family protein [Vicinamibacterales bacterium]|jgi:septal ring factor EnvC (AmiA/AmiB activator)|nr:peptidoglycan DD-metalloendopeptidase family protein [Vicinamibacterales bacterium]
MQAASSGSRYLGIIALACLIGTALPLAQQPATSASSTKSRVDERLRALRQEADRLVSQSKTLLGEVRKLEILRDIRAAESQEAERALTASQDELNETSRRLELLEEQRLRGLPDLKRQLAETYKRGRSGYLRLLVSAGDLRGFARATRAMTALTFRQERVLGDYHQTVDALRAEHSVLETKMAELKTRDATARRARGLAEKAVADRAALIAQIDSRRDLTAQYVGELQVARERLDQQLTGLAAGKAALAVPLAPFRGGLEWPAPGELASRFGQPAGPQAGPLVRSGVEIAAPEGTSVRAIHSGTVGYAEGYTGLGTLVILDHGGNNYSLYGYLLSLSVQRGEVVEAGAEVGRVGPSPAGPPELYFELRIDGRSVDPVQWLKPRAAR